MTWKKVKIGEVCEVGRGSSPRPIADPKYFEGGRIPWIKIADASASLKYIYETREFVNEYGASFSRKLPPGSLIIATSGVSLGQIKFLGVEGCIHDGWLYCQDYNGIDKEFLYYRLLLLWDYFHSKSYGAAIQNINTSILRETEIELPTLDVQLKISQILSAYDNLIENNLRRIQLLEEAARCRYKLMMEESSAWVKAPVQRAIEYHIGGGWGNDTNLADFTKPGYVIRGTDIPGCRCGDSSGVPFRYHKESNLRTRKLEAGDIVFEVSGGSKTSPVGRALLVSEELLSGFDVEVMCASFCKLLRPSQDITPEYLYLFLLESYENGALKPFEKPSASNIINFAFETYLQEAFISVPPRDILKEFSDHVGAYLKLIANIGKQNIRLRQARDLLLPRLMSGEIDVTSVPTPQIETEILETV